MLLSVWALAVGSSIPEVPAGSGTHEGQGDLALYERIETRVADGESYYRAAVDEQAADGYPTSPPPTVRLPTVTIVWLVAGEWTPWLLRLLVALSVVAVMLRFERIAPAKPEWIASTLLFVATTGLFLHPSAGYFAEAWAVCLIVLSLAVHRAGRWRLSMILGLTAVLFRELAGPYLVVMGVMAWRRNRREAYGWFAGAAAFCALYGVHWQLADRAAAMVGKVSSDPWVTFGGWPYVVDTVRFSSVLRAFPYWVSVIVVAAAVVGWVAARGPFRDRVLAISFTFIAIFMIAGRPNTAYWGTLYVPLLVPALIFVPRAACRAVAAAWRRPTPRTAGPPC
ncbi:hypothetical protein GL325_08465 [Aeromicrobium sp. 636]|uniref:Uncharacterized protein n=1 Tax=Aeromicrobium senzhongii TaxID=2663859 RepID=A0A8I0ETW2_9ACTN|nr:MULTISPECIES: hypothetical protein [Aeromicrobium]MBC9226351.1 hypothetical protein [Aeromicrobium senzhongii]MCQ3998456.1 hypothetical protein [Aeromicrobium sp. 636]